MHKDLEKLAKNKTAYKKILILIDEIQKQEKLNPYINFEPLTKNVNQFLWTQYFGNDKSELYYTSNIELVTGYTPEEVINLPEHGLSLICEEDLPDVRKELDLFINDLSRNNLQLIYRIKKKNGNIAWMKEYITIDRLNGVSIYRINGSAADITELKEVECDLRESQEKLKQMNEAKDKFISILSHDLRAPFTSILGFSEILMNEKSLPDNEKYEYLNYIYEASQTQLQLINYLLDWSRLQTGRLKIDPQRIKTHALIYNCISALTGNAIRKNIRIKASVNEDIYVQGDERLLTQAIINLLNNAIKFTQEGKRIDIYVNRYNDFFIEFIVKDQGVGIPDSHKDKIFRIDDKLTTEGTKGEKGSGFGLSLVKEIIEKHHGNIWFYSEENIGSEFHFTIPVAQNSIFIVEENKSDRELYKKIIHKSLPDFKITEAENGFEAMSILLTQVPSVVIINHDLPLMNGLQLIEAMKKGDSVLKTPVVITGSGLTNLIIEEYHKSGIVLIFEKPLESDSFGDVLKSIV